MPSRSSCCCCCCAVRDCQEVSSEKEMRCLLFERAACEQHTSHVTFFSVLHKLVTRTRLAQVVSLACAHHIPCVILMRSCCVFDSLRLRCGGQIPCAFSLMRTLALLPSTTLSHSRGGKCVLQFAVRRGIDHVKINAKLGCNCGVSATNFAVSSELTFGDNKFTPLNFSLFC